MDFISIYRSKFHFGKTLQHKLGSPHPIAVRHSQHRIGTLNILQELSGTIGNGQH